MNSQRATIPGLTLVHQGKVRDCYALGDDLLLVATDRISAFDVVMSTDVPGKGAVLTGLAAFWFGQTGGLIVNHLLTCDPLEMPLPAATPAAALRGRAMLVRRAARIDVECVVRGYLAGSAWEEYRARGTVADEPLPRGLRLGDQLPEPRFTPALKVETGHDINVTRNDVGDRFGVELAEQLEQTSLNLYLAAAEFAATKNMLLADTKFEFGLIDGQLTLIDEALTPDSSRYWEADAWQPGISPPSFDKQFVRDFLASSGWNRQAPGPALPPEVIAGTQARYFEAHRRLTGRTLTYEAEVGWQ